jgi:pimeloyl-ACP methyl ester carboxylesterase
VVLGKLMWRHGEDHNPARTRALRAGVTEELFVSAFAVTCPLTRPALLPRDRLFVIAGRGDRITPPEQAEMLAAHWGVPVRWFDGGHLAQIGRGELMRDVRREIGRFGFAGRDVRMAPRARADAPR